jgi:hypothetical protein
MATAYRRITSLGWDETSPGIGLVAIPAECCDESVDVTVLWTESASNAYGRSSASKVGEAVELSIGCSGRTKPVAQFKK